MLTKKLQKILNRLQLELSNIIYESLQKNMSPAQIEKAIMLVIDNYNLAKQMNKEIQKELSIVVENAKAAAERNYSWIKKHTIDVSKTEPALKIVEFSQNEFARAQGLIENNVVKSIMANIRKQVKFEEIQNQLIHDFKKPSTHAFTIANTAIAAYDSTVSLGFSCEAGVLEKKYSGPASRRPFCSSHLGKTYSLIVLAEMTNDFGQSALIYRGGWNCRHWWENVIAKIMPTPAQIQEAMNVFNRLKIAA